MAILSELSEGSSSSSPASVHRYDVFLNFRGLDTRLGFTDHLLKALVDGGFDTFYDDEEVETGEDLKPELVRAIKASRASIVVLSKNYASSTWCLDELVLILEQRRTSGHIVIPIFYHVEPTHVRKQQKEFGDALATYKRMMDAETNPEKRSQWAQKLDLWKKALAEVSNLKGEDAEGRYETEFIEEIVMDVNRKLGLHLRSDLPLLIGRSYSIEFITSWLKDGSSHTADILSIVGMIGMGKTSLAKHVHGLHCHLFDRSSFIEDVGRKCAEQFNGLLGLQMQLLHDISKPSRFHIRGVSAYTSKIEKALLRKKVLLVLDGIDSYKQLDALLGKKGFHPGSKIIITTEEESLIEKCALFNMNAQPKEMKHLPKPKHTNHELVILEKPESLQVFCLHAFRCDDPTEGYEDMSSTIVEYCQGLPLALEVLGSSLYNKDVDAWEDTLKDLEKEVHPHIPKILQISFDSLPSEKDKKLFMLIACFFVGEDVDFTEKILKACDLCNSSGIKNLIDRRLLITGLGDKLMMHQLVQKMGRDAIRQESPEKPWKRSLLWNHEDCFNVLKEKKGKTKIQGLFLDMKKFENEISGVSSSASKKKLEDDHYNNLRSSLVLHSVCVLFLVIWRLFRCVFGRRYSFDHQKVVFEVDTFSKMSNLRLLQLNYVHLNGSYKSFPQGLRWLCMQGFTLSCIPSDLQMKNVVALDMSYSNLQQPWKKPKVLGSLKFLNLSYCDKLVRVGHFSGLPVLETLKLAGCVSLIEVCESIENCDKLVLLDLHECSKLKGLPRSIGKLKKLTTLLINGCRNLGEFPVEMKDMDSLQVLDANSIGVIPKSFKWYAISLPGSLVSLSLRNNNLFNESFPMEFTSLSMLKNLCLDENPIVDLPNCVRSLSSLTSLSLEGCHMLGSVLCPPSTITHLWVNKCDSLGKITFHPQMSKLPVIYSGASETLTEIGGLFKMEGMADIDEEVLCSLGWHNLQHVKNYKLLVWHFRADLPKLRPVQILYEHGIFSTFFEGIEVPSWFSHTRKGMFTSFTIQSSLSIKALNVCFVYTLSGIKENGLFTVTVTNLTKKRNWCYWPRTYGVGEGSEESIVWLSHWMFGNDEFEDGDKVSCELCTMGSDDVNKNVHVRECGISVVYDDGKWEEDDPLAYYKSWKCRIGGDQSVYELSPGFYCIMEDL